MPTYLMRNSEGGVKPVVFNDSTAPLWRADGANVRHAQGVAGVVATEVLDKGNDPRLNQLKESMIYIRTELFQLLSYKTSLRVQKTRLACSSAVQAKF